jgi:hypothetical protein
VGGAPRRRRQSGRVGEARGRHPLPEEQVICHGVWRPGGEPVALAKAMGSRLGKRNER